MSLEVFGDGGNDEDLIEFAADLDYQLCSDGLFREDMAEDGFSEEQMWQYIWDKRESDEENLLEIEANLE